MQEEISQSNSNSRIGCIVAILGLL